jgi:hypothetical protein
LSAQLLLNALLTLPDAFELLAYILKERPADESECGADCENDTQSHRGSDELFGGLWRRRRLSLLFGPFALSRDLFFDVTPSRRHS